ncbi:hypothetical protein AALP_AA8G207600 [Arabis alpina]|uniref:Uncharacterized protein n=1 Tax=Arabis alpina TaxID=50452 RepID=A0A087G8C9_ARAAL|nr:hypothetical protein AALP_AA8G207600 [Arabis alpina]
MVTFHRFHPISLRFHLLERFYRFWIPNFSSQVCGLEKSKEFAEFGESVNESDGESHLKIRLRDVSKAHDGSAAAVKVTDEPHVLNKTPYAGTS